jgi:CheY-like chemotaxis protein
VAPSPELSSGSYIKLSVEDTGEGIDPAIIDRIFDPFFTTKEQGIGTGLGLSVVHGIVKSVGGAIVVESYPGRGSAFHVYLPLVIQREDQPVAETKMPLPGGKERILIVDDEPSLAFALSRLLQRLGYDAEYRLNGIEALDAVRGRSADNAFDLVITDMTMPHLTGAELTKQLLDFQPDLTILICTGYSEKMDSQKAQSLGAQGLLMKPIALKDLAIAVREALDHKNKVTTGTASLQPQSK